MPVVTQFPDELRQLLPVTLTPTEYEKYGHYGRSYAVLIGHFGLWLQHLKLTPLNKLVQQLPNILAECEESFNHTSARGKAIRCAHLSVSLPCGRG